MSITLDPEIRIEKNVIREFCYWYLICLTGTATALQWSDETRRGGDPYG